MILLARAIARKPSFLFLDEATSALDNTTQKKITKALRALNMTRLMIAHRFSTIQQADRIYVMEKGTIVQQGTFDTLMAEEGLFSALMQPQT